MAYRLAHIVVTNSSISLVVNLLVNVVIKLTNTIHMLMLTYDLSQNKHITATYQRQKLNHNLGDLINRRMADVSL